ncbi:hypothetical protein DRP04_13095, partial [Archaeoglobales archaeon]
MVKILSKLFGSKNPVESMSIDELRIMEIKLNKKIEELQSEVKQIENEIQVLFEKARVARTKSEEVSLARRIKTLTQKKEMKLAAQAQLEKELRAVSNVLILKEHEQDLQSAGVWDKLKRLKPEQLESWLISKNLEAKDRDEIVTSVVEMTSMAMTAGVSYEEDLDEILEAIRAVKSGDMEPDEAERVVSREK